MTLQSVPPPPCLCQHGAEWHSRNYHICTRCLCNKYRPDKHQYPTGQMAAERVFRDSLRDVEALFDADRPGRWAWWCAVWVPPLARSRLVYDPPSPPRPEVGRYR